MDDKTEFALIKDQYEQGLITASECEFKLIDLLFDLHKGDSNTLKAFEKHLDAYSKAIAPEFAKLLANLEPFVS